MKSVWDYSHKLLKEVDHNAPMCNNMNTILGFDDRVKRLQLTLNAEILVRRQYRHFEADILELQIRNIFNLIRKHDKVVQGVAPLETHAPEVISDTTNNIQAHNFPLLIS